MTSPISTRHSKHWVLKLEWFFEGRFKKEGLVFDFTSLSWPTNLSAAPRRRISDEADNEIVQSV